MIYNKNVTNVVRASGAPLYRLELNLCVVWHHRDVQGEGKSGNKAWLRRRHHVAIVSDHLESDGA